MDNSTQQPVEYIIIDFWDKVYIAGGAGLFLLTVFLCMLCVLCPEKVCCCCYSNKKHEDEDLPARARRKTGSQKSNSSRSSYGSTGSYGSPDGSEANSLKWTPLKVIKEQDAAGSDASSDTGYDVIQLDKNKQRIGYIANGVHSGEGSEHVSFKLESGTIEFQLSYLWSEEKLVIKILEISDVRLSGDHALVSPYVKIRIYRTPKQFFTFRDQHGGSQVINNLEKEMKTKMRRPSDVLTYKETFEIAVDADTLKTFTLCLLLCDMNKLSRHVTLGEITLPLRKAKLQEVKEVTFTEKFKPPYQENLGKVTVGLCYLPTSEKMYLTVEGIKDLKPVDREKGSTDPFVKVYLMYEGKQLKRVKTSVKTSELNPVFSETFNFDVPVNEINKVYFSLVVCHFSAEKKGTKMIGRLYLGMNFDPEAQEHWNNMVENPRQKIVQSYRIIN